MRKKYYKFIIDNEEVPYGWIPVDENGITDQNYYSIQKMFDNYETILNISYLDYDPEPDSIWDGKDFKGKLENRLLTEEEKSKTRFAFISKDNVYLGGFKFGDSPEGQMYSSIYNSNGKIVEDRIVDE